jgi:hypothetical protein
MKVKQYHESSSMTALNHVYYWCWGKQQNWDNFLSKAKPGDILPDFVQYLVCDRDTSGFKVMYN